MPRWIVLGIALSPPAGAVELTAPDVIVGGEPATVAVTGATPQALVGIVASPGGLGPGRCVPTGGDCLDLLEPVILLTDLVRADAQGEASWTLTPPDGPTDDFHLQAFQLSGPAVVSATQPLTLLESTSDTDADGARAAFELMAGTDPLDPDTDDDGVLDGVDLWPLTPQAPDPWQAAEQTASNPTRTLADPEFDAASLQATWQTIRGSEVWTCDVDPVTGVFVPPDCRGRLVDTGALPLTHVQNGPEWLVGNTGSRVLYGKEVGGLDKVMVAEDVGGTWVPGVMTSGVAPFGSLDPTNPAPRVYYSRRTSFGPQSRVREVDTPGTDVQSPELLAYGRWIPGERGLVALAEDPQGHHQAVRMDPVTGQLDWWTSSTTAKHHVFAWHAPELQDRRVLMVTVSAPGSTRPTAIEVFEETAQGWVLLDVLRPPPGAPYVVSPEPFVWNGRSYVVFLASRQPFNYNNGQAQVWLVDIDPTTTFGRQLSAPTTRVLKDPEPMLLPDRPVVYFTEVGAGGLRIIRVAETGL